MSNRLGALLAVGVSLAACSNSSASVACHQSPNRKISEFLVKIPKRSEVIAYLDSHQIKYSGDDWEIVVGSQWFAVGPFFSKKELLVMKFDNSGNLFEYRCELGYMGP